MVRGSVLRTPEQVKQDILARLVEVDGCLLWPGATFPDGYGLISWGGKHLGVHRLLWELTFGELEDGLLVDHKCRNKLCANLVHLHPVTHGANMQNRAMESKTSASGVLNVLYRVRGKCARYEVRMRSDGKDYHFGAFVTLEEATAVAIKKRKQLFPNSNPEITTTQQDRK